VFFNQKFNSSHELNSPSEDSTKLLTSRDPPTIERYQSNKSNIQYTNHIDAETEMLCSFNEVHKRNTCH